MWVHLENPKSKVRWWTKTSKHIIMQEKGLSCNKQSYQADEYHTIKVLSSICESESCWSEQAIKWSSKVIKHVKIAKQSSKQIESPCLEKMGYPLIDQSNATFSSTSVQAWSSKIPSGVANLWTRIFHVRPHSIGKTRFLFVKIWFLKKKLESPLILFLF